MAYQGIGTGTTPNDGTGDSLYSGAVKINNNFKEIYNSIGDGTNITNTINYSTTSGGLTGTPNVVVGIITASSFVDNIGNVRSIPQNLKTNAYVLAKSDAGKHVAISTGGVTLNASIFSIGDAVTIYNNSAYTQMINVGSAVTMRRVSVGDTGSRGLDQYGLATILCIGSNSYVISGVGLT